MPQHQEHSRLPPLKSLQVFEASARLQSFKMAANELFVTPAAISHQIRILEEHLGVKLFERESNGIILSKDGKNLYPNIKSAFNLIHDSITQLQSYEQNQSIKLTAGPAFTSKWLATRLTEFKQLQADINVEMEASLSIFDFRKSGIDLAVRFGNASKLSDVTSVPLVEEAVVPVVSPKLIEKLGRALLPSDLTNLELIHDRSLSMVQQDSPDWKEWCELNNIHNVDTTKGLTFNHADHAIQAAIDGAGVALARLVVATTDINSGRLIIPFGPIIPSRLHFYLLARNEILTQPKIQIFMDWLKAIIKQDIQLVADKNNDSCIANLLHF